MAELFNSLNKKRRLMLMLIDAAISVMSYLISIAFTGMHHYDKLLLIGQMIIFSTIFIGTFSAMGVYKNMIRYAGIQDICQCLKASAVGNILFIITTYRLDIEMNFYQYFFVFLTSSFCTGALRVVYRTVKILIKKSTETKVKKNVMIIGAGRATDLLLCELDFNNPYNYSVKCIIDDDKSKKGRDLHNIPIVGDRNKIAEMASKYLIELIIISIPSIDIENKKNIIDICSTTKCKIKILPAICSLISYEDKINLSGKVRDLRVEDLLGRDPILFDSFLIKKYIKNKTVLVTGGGGSIGSELCRQISSYSPKKLIILDIYENSVYEIQQELKRKYNDSLNLEIEIASIRDKEKLDKIFASKKIDVVFHAAAHKHVPLMEHNPEEAIKNNIMGTFNLVKLADKYNVDKFILISTDKAVNPTSVMGATKRVCEMIVQSFDKNSSTDFVAVRFGNVLGSNGSVIPLFINQIKEGGPVTVTDENITRYFMTIEEAVQLVMKAASIAKGGEIFVLDMGEPVKIKDLAFKLISMYGLTPNIDIKIVYTGLRAGEKHTEELFLNDALLHEKTDIDKIFIEKPLDFDEEKLFNLINEMESAAKSADKELIFNLLKQIIPTFNSNYFINDVKFL